jgi:hypothetical protein
MQKMMMNARLKIEQLRSKNNLELCQKLCKHGNDRGSTFGTSQNQGHDAKTSEGIYRQGQKLITTARGRYVYSARKAVQHQCREESSSAETGMERGSNDCHNLMLKVVREDEAKYGSMYDYIGNRSDPSRLLASLILF